LGNILALEGVVFNQWSGLLSLWPLLLQDLPK
jgi:hypothetical protein